MGNAAAMRKHRGAPISQENRLQLMVRHTVQGIKGGGCAHLNLNEGNVAAGVVSVIDAEGHSMFLLGGRQRDLRLQAGLEHDHGSPWLAFSCECEHRQRLSASAVEIALDARNVACTSWQHCFQSLGRAGRCDREAGAATRQQSCKRRAEDKCPQVSTSFAYFWSSKARPNFWEMTASPTDFEEPILTRNVEGREIFGHCGRAEIGPSEGSR